MPIDMDRVHFICRLTGGVPCTDDEPDACTPENCYIAELLEIGKNANAADSKD